MNALETGVIITQHLKNASNSVDAKYTVIETLTAIGYSSTQIIQYVLTGAKNTGINDVNDVDDAFNKMWLEIHQVKGTFVWSTALEIVAKSFVEAFADGKLDVSDIWIAIRNVYVELFGKENKI